MSKDDRCAHRSPCGGASLPWMAVAHLSQRPAAPSSGPRVCCGFEKTSSSALCLDFLKGRASGGEGLTLNSGACARTWPWILSSNLDYILF